MIVLCKKGKKSFLHEPKLGEVYIYIIMLTQPTFNISTTCYFDEKHSHCLLAKVVIQPNSLSIPGGSLS